MTEQDLIIQDLRRENAMLKEQLAQYINTHGTEQKWQVRYCGGGHLYCDGICNVCSNYRVHYTVTGGTN